MKYGIETQIAVIAEKELEEERNSLEYLQKTYKNVKFERVTDFDVLSGGHTLFFRSDSGAIYEVLPPNYNWINTYSENYLREAVEVNRYSGKVMWRSEMEEFLASDAIKDLFEDGKGKTKKCNAVIATLKALEYNTEWIQEMLEPALKRSHGLNCTP